ncbi:MAG: NAD(P)-dependent oxidoreductase [Pseudomonadota bacterium]
MSEPKTAAFIGLGVMGYPMAGHLQAKGFATRVYNRSGAKAEAWVAQHGGTSAPTPRAAAEGADIVFCCVGNDQDLEQVTLGDEGAFHGLKQGGVFVDHTTASADIARRLDAAAKEMGFGFLDAPVSGGQAGAENGVLTIIGRARLKSSSAPRPMMEAFGRAVTLIGPAGAGQLAKMVNQICIAGLLQGLSEALSFADKAGLDAKLVLDVISKGAAQSWQMENRGTTMVDDTFDFGFAVDWMRKDLGICMAEANRIGAPLPVTALVDQFYKDVQGLGGGRWDTSSLIKRLK